MALSQAQLNKKRAKKAANNKARKQSNSTINGNKYIKLLSDLATVLLTQDPTHDYKQTANSLDVAKTTIAHYSFNMTHYLALQEISDQFDRQLKAQYGATLVTGPMSWGQDMQATLTHANVPQKIRVMRGLFDTLLSVLGVRLGAINVQHIHIKA